MGLFTVGNLLTLGIALLFLLLFRYLDKNNRHMKSLHEYSGKLKKDLAAFMGEQESAIKDYGISLNVERESAKELMKRLLLTEEELAEKAATMARIDGQIKSYENSLGELDKMTSRVQENMNRIREESAFVETTGKRLNEAKNRMEELVKELGSIENKFEKKNTEALDKSVNLLLTGVKATVSELSASAETIERQVNDHRQEIDKIETQRATDMARDLEHINHILKTAVEQAGERAGKIEEAALANLREQAEDRIRRLKTAEEERLKAYQESARARVTEAQALVKNFHEEWQAERDGWASKDKTLREEREKDIQELNTALEDSQQRLNAAKALFETQMQEFAEQTDQMISSQEALLFKAAADMRQKSLEMTGDKLEEYSEKWLSERAAWENKDKELREEREKDIQELNTALEDSQQRLNAAKTLFDTRMREFAERTGQMISSQEALLLKDADDMRQKSLEITGTRLEEYSEKWLAERAAWENKDKELREEREKDLQELNTALEDSQQRLNAAKALLDTHIREFAERTGQMISSQEALLLKNADDMRQKSLEITGTRLEEYSEKWLAERAAWEDKDKALREEREKAIQEFNAGLEDSERRLAISLEDSEKRLIAAKADFETEMREFAARTGQMISSQEALLLSAAEDMRRKSLEITGGRLEEYSEKWLAERTGWENKDKALREEREKDIREFNASIGDSQERLAAALEDSEKRLNTTKALFESQMQELSDRANRIVSSQEAMLVKAAEEMKHKALEITETKLEEYRHAQEGEFRRLETLADDSRKLDTELRRSMQDVISKAQEDFSRYEQESSEARKTEFDKFNTAAASLRKELAEIEKELDTLRSAAHDNVSEALKSFEDNFFADIAKRSGEIDQRLMAWQDGLDTRLSRMGEEAETGRKELERGLTEEMRKQLAAHDTRLVSSLERLKEETSAFGKRIQGEMLAADESVASLKEQLAGSFEEARKDSDIFIRAEIGKHSLAAAETIKKYQRELEEKLLEMSGYLQTRNSEITLLIDASRADLAEAKDGITGKVRELDDSIEDARRRVRDLTAETDTRIASVRSSVEDTERHIREAVDQTKIIDKAEALRLDLARRIEDLKADMDRLDQRKEEAAKLENDFVKIKRLEDDVNAKMARFISEQRKIETMETDFNRLLKISRVVDEKLTQVTASHDNLQEMELKLRKLEEALGTTEEKFQRIDRKNQILDNTNDGIDRNFRILQEAEKLSAKIGGDLGRYTEDLSSIKTSIEKLSGESEKARQAVDKIEVLDELLQEIEDRTQSMQRSKQWLAETETRLEELNRQAQTQARAIDGLMKGKKSGVIPDLGPGAPSVQKKENVIALAKQGWEIDAIAKALRLSRGEVELILQMAQLD